MHLVSSICPVFSLYSTTNYFHGWGLFIWHVCVCTESDHRFSTARETVGSGGQTRDVVCVCVSVWEATGQGEDPGPAAARTVCLSPATRGIHVVCTYIMYIFPSNGPPSRSAREGNFTIHHQKKKKKTKHPAMSVLYFEVSLVVYFCLSLLQSLTCFGHSQNLLHVQVISGILSCLIFKLKVISKYLRMVFNVKRIDLILSNTEHFQKLLCTSETSDDLSTSYLGLLSRRRELWINIDLHLKCIKFQYALKSIFLMQNNSLQTPKEKESLLLFYLYCFGV